jgi:hypothetical protein
MAFTKQLPGVLHVGIANSELEAAVRMTPTVQTLKSPFFIIPPYIVLIFMSSALRRFLEYQ